MPMHRSTTRPPRALLSAIALLGLLAATHTLSAQSIHAGSAAGSYTNDFCPQVQQAVAAEFFEHTCVTSEGSADNAEKVLANPHDVGIGQLDVIASFADQNPGELAIVDPELGLECLYAVTSQPDVSSLRGLSPRMPVALPSARSGSAATFGFLQELDEQLAALRNITHHDGPLEAVQAVADGDAALAFFVQFPNTSNPVFEAINSADLTFVPVVNRQILRREVGGVQVYQPREVTVTPTGLLGRLTGREDTKLVTTCTPVVLFTGTADRFEAGTVEHEDQVALIEQLAATQAPTSGDWTDILRNAVQVSRDRVERFLE